MNLRNTSFFGLALLTVMSAAACKAVPLTAPSGASFTITANPTSIPAAGGTSAITMVMFKAEEDGGGTVADGTQIFLTTNLGLIEERVATTAGIARATLQSNGRAGTATITASSGTATADPRTVEVQVGAGINILLTANPPTVSPPDFTTELVATVFDADNNRVADVPVIFTTSAGALASQSTSLRTNSVGQASDRLTLLSEASATVTVFSGQVASNAVTVSRGTEPGPVVTSISPTSGQPGETLNVTINGLNFQPGAVVSFGEGISVNSVTFVNSNQLVVNITIDPNIQNTSSSRTVTVTNPDGSSGSLTGAFRIITLNPSPLITSLNPTVFSIARNSNLLVTINGLNFLSGAQVTFSSISTAGPVSIISTVVNSSNRITVTITADDPVSVGGTGPEIGTVFEVRVINPDGLQSNGQNFTFN